MTARGCSERLRIAAPWVRAYPGAMAWMPFLKLVSPASAYVRRAKEEVRGQRRGRPRRMNPGSRLRPLAVWAAPDPHESGLFPRGPSHWAERRRELDVAHREDVTRGAEELLRTGATVIPTSGGPLHARLVRFWNGTAVLDCRAPATERSDGRTFTR